MEEINLWNRLRQGDPQALGVLYDEYYQSLINYGLRISIRHDLVEDSLQDLFVDIWNSHSRLGETDSVKNYLFSSFRRNLIKKLKAGMSITAFEPEQKPEEADDFNFLNETIIREENQEMTKRISKAMETLSSRQKEVIYLRYQEGLEYDQIGKTMKLQYQSVRNLVSTALLKLKENIVLMSMIFLPILSTNISIITFNSMV